MKSHRFRSSVILILCLLAALTLACIFSGSTTDTPNSPPPPSETSRAAGGEQLRPTLTPTNPPLASDTPAPEPQETPTPLPPTPQGPVPISEEGPWVLYTSDIGIFIMNWDGSGLTLLHDFQVVTPYVASSRLFPAPQGGRLAVIELYSMDGSTINFPRLKVLRVPSGQVELDLPLIPEDYETNEYFSDQEVADQIFAATGIWNEMAWSHDGTMLAFNAAIDGPSVDLYMYSTQDGSVTRLTDGPSQSVKPVFSPDDAYIVHGAVETLYYGYSGAGYGYENIWAASTNGQGVHKVYDNSFIGYEYILGWTSNTGYMAASWENFCGYFNVRMVDINGGEGEMIYSGHHAYDAYSPRHGVMLFSVDDFIYNGQCGEVQSSPGVYLLDVVSKQEMLLPDIDPEQVSSVIWHEESSQFFVSMYSDSFYAVSPGGAVIEYQAPAQVSYVPPLVSPDGERWVFLTDNLFAFGDSDGRYNEYGATSPNNPIWPGNSTLVLFFADIDSTIAIWGSAIPGPRPLVIQPDVWPPRGIEKIVLVNP